MDITMGLPTFHPHGRKEQLEWYRKIDEGPWDGLATWDRVLYPGGWSLIPELAGAAAMTERVKLWSCIVIPTIREPVMFAKDLATIDVLSGGRLFLGLGIGSYDEDYIATGNGLSQKRQRMDANVETMQEVWSQKSLVDGYMDYPAGPEPVQAGGIPLIAGVSGPKAIARAAKWAVGVTDPASTSHIDADYLIAQRELIEQTWKDAGRTDKPHFSACSWFGLGPNAKEQTAQGMYDFCVHNPTGDQEMKDYFLGSPHAGPEGLRHIVDTARAAGLDDIILIPTTSDPNEIDRAREALGI